MRDAGPKIDKLEDYEDTVMGVPQRHQLHRQIECQDFSLSEIAWLPTVLYQDYQPWLGSRIRLRSSSSASSMPCFWFPQKPPTSLLPDQATSTPSSSLALSNRKPSSAAVSITKDSMSPAVLAGSPSPPTTTVAYPLLGNLESITGIHLFQ